MLLPQEIAEKLSPTEFIKLHEKVEKKFKVEFGIVSIDRVGKNRIKAVVELKDNVRHTVIL